MSGKLDFRDALKQRLVAFKCFNIALTFLSPVELMHFICLIVLGHHTTTS